MKLIARLILGLLILFNTVSVFSQVTENNSKVIMSEADMASLVQTLKKYKKAKSETIENNNLNVFSHTDNSYEIAYLRHRLALLENQQNNAEIYKNNNSDNDYKIRSMQNELLQLESLLNSKKLSLETNNPNIVVIPNNPNVVATDYQEPVSAKNDEINAVYRDRLNQPNNAEVYRNNNQDNDYKIRAMQNEILQLRSLLNNQKLSSETNKSNVVASDSDKPVYAKYDEIKIVSIDSLKNTGQPSVLEKKIDSLNFALKAIEENEANLLNTDFDSIQKKLSDLKNTINAKNELSKKYESSTTGYVNYKKQLFFESNKKELDLNQITILDELVSILAGNDNIDVFIKGFASNKGNPVYNENLSLQRTESVKKLLVSKGIHPTRILTQYHGIDYESASDELARRVDIELLIRK